MISDMYERYFQVKIILAHIKSRVETCTFNYLIHFMSATNSSPMNCHFHTEAYDSVIRPKMHKMVCMIHIHENNTVCQICK